MYAIEVIETEQNLNWDWQVVQDVNAINPNTIYAKTKLAQMWGVHRTTIRRWIDIAADANAPGFKRGFSRVVRLANCPECAEEIDLTELQYLQLNRNWSINCPHCSNRIKAEPHLKEVIDLDQRVPGTHAKVLRIVGWLINTYGIESTHKILDDSPDPSHKQIRQAIRKILIQEA